MISVKSKCFNNIAVGDRVIVRLLPAPKPRRIFTALQAFPVIGKSPLGVPVIGSMDSDVYYNHFFFSTRHVFRGGTMLRWTYASYLDSLNIQIEYVIKTNSRLYAPYGYMLQDLPTQNE